MWKNLRERYARELKVLKSIPTGTSPKEVKWYLFKHLSFLEKYIKPRKTASNYYNQYSECKISDEDVKSVALNHPKQTVDKDDERIMFIIEDEDENLENEDNRNTMFDYYETEAVNEDVNQNSPNFDIILSEVAPNNSETATVSRNVEIRSNFTSSNNKNTQDVRQSKSKYKKSERNESPLQAIGDYFSNKKTSNSDQCFGAYVGQYLSEISDNARKDRLKTAIMQVLHSTQ